METGIDIEPLAEGMAPEFECREAAVYCRYTPREFWSDLDRRERAMCVAQYRLHRLIEAHGEDAVSAAVDRQSRR